MLLLLAIIGAMQLGSLCRGPGASFPSVMTALGILIRCIMKVTCGLVEGREEEGEELAVGVG